MDQRVRFLANFLYQNGLKDSTRSRLFTLKDIRVGTKLSDWRSRIKAGLPATTAYSAHRYNILKRTDFVAHHYSLIRNQLGGPYVGAAAYDANGFADSNNSLSWMGHFATIPSSANVAALTKLHERIRSASYGANGLLFLGELRETVHMIRHPAEALRKSVSTYMSALKSTQRQVAKKIRPKKGDSNGYFVKKRLTAVKDAMAGSWLELQFGVKPLLLDIKEIATTALDMHTNASKVQRVSAFSNFEHAITYPEGGITRFDPILVLRENGHSLTTGGVKYIAGIRARTRAPLDSLGALSEFGFDFQNFVPTIYELIPYSFLVDYFLNVGDVLGSMFTNTTDVAWVVKTERTSTHRTRHQYPAVSNSMLGYWDPIEVQLESGECETLLVTLNRTASTVPWVPLELKMPGIDSSKWFNMAALVATANKSRKGLNL